MSGTESTPPRQVPTLTDVVDVVDWPAAARPSAPGVGLATAPALSLAVALGQSPGLSQGQSQGHGPGRAPIAPPAKADAAPPEPLSALPSEAQLVEQILGEVQRQIDLMLEYRLREALMPVLARATENLIRDARGELASTLRDVVARAVAREIARHRSH